MPICTQCGYILHESDAGGHVCKDEDKPKAGKPRKPTTTEVNP